MKFPLGSFFRALFLALVALEAPAAVTPEEASQLGRDLTLFGAEMAGNKDGSIPAYTGGLTIPPAGFDARSGVRPDPFTAEKPQFAIDAQGLSRHAARLSEGTKALLKAHADFRLDIYPSHRTVVYPKAVLDQTLKNATRAALTPDGLGMTGARGGIPFPIPKSGPEAMHNVHARYAGLVQYIPDFRHHYADAGGKVVMSARASLLTEFPYYDERREAVPPVLLRARREMTHPPSQAGNMAVQIEPLNYADNDRRYWQYLPGQRRARLLPDVAYDTINGVTGGIGTVDDLYLFSGKLDRFDFHLAGKRELYVPYNTYRFAYHDKPEEVFLPKFINPRLLRWELHRVWVVEATRRESARHVYSRRVFYIDEDSWAILASDQYDADGRLSHAGFSYLHQAYDVAAPVANSFGHHDLVDGGYYVLFWPGPGGVKFPAALLPDTAWTPESIAGQGVR
jgi:hypothetical protein